MTLNLYALKDEHNGFTPPELMPNDEMAKRRLREMKESALSVKVSPEDFSIWRIGKYDTETGIIESEVTLIERAN